MNFYNAVKLTQIGVDNPRIGYALVETQYIDGQKIHRLERGCLENEAWELGMLFAYKIEENYEENFSRYTSLSFKAPCDLIMRKPNEPLYRVEDFPIELRDEFSKAILDEMRTWGV